MSDTIQQPRLPDLPAPTTLLLKAFLDHAARLSATKESVQSIISTTVILYAMNTFVPEDNADIASLKERLMGIDRVYTELDLFNTIRQSIGEFDLIIANVWGRISKTDDATGGTPASIRTFEFSTSIRTALTQISPSGDAMGLPRFLRLVFSGRSSTLEGRLLRGDIDPERIYLPLLRVLASLEFDIQRDEIGDYDRGIQWNRRRYDTNLPGVRIHRDLQEHDAPALRTDQYASALAALFRAATGEFCCGLFGQWGIGKTYLSELLERKLTKPEATRQADDARLTQRYQVIRFSAWRYPQTPEAWIFLYETLLTAFFAQPWLVVQAARLRVGICRHGIVTLAISMIVLPVSLLSPLQVMKILDATTAATYSVVGMSGLILLASTLLTVRKFISKTKHIMRRYSTLASHRQQLGMQALIGEDLRLLLLGWLPVVLGRTNDNIADRGRQGASRSRFQFQRHSLFLPWKGLLILSAVVILILTIWVICGTCNQIQIILVGFLSIAITSIVCFGAFGPRAIVRSPDRLLLIVDDLDRLDPTVALSIMEALKLLVQDREISDRLQVLMLVDDEMLEAEIRLRFSGLASAGGMINDDRIVEEHMDKIFLCHLRLNPLSNDEVGGLVTHYTRIWNTPPQEGKNNDSMRQEPKIDSNNNSSPSPLRQNPSLAGDNLQTPDFRADAVSTEVPLPSDSLDLRIHSSIYFSDNVVRSLEHAVRALHLTTAGPRMSPRAVKAFLFRYQLSRLILDQAGLDYDEIELVATLRRISALNRSERREHIVQFGNYTEYVVKQVT